MLVCLQNNIYKSSPIYREEIKEENVRMDYRVLLYYKYVTIDDPETFASEHLEFCKENNLKGRILVSTEGINGTLSGTKRHR